MIRGSVTYLQRIALSPTAVVTVRLLDVSNADAPAETISELVIEADGRQVPFPFELSYDPAEIEESGRYAVSATIDDEGRSRFRTTTACPVVTQGAPGDDVELVLDMIG